MLRRFFNKSADRRHPVYYLLPTVYFFNFLLVLNAQQETVSPYGKAIIASILLPGTGELILGDKIKSKIFYGVEGIIWLGYAGFQWYGSSRNNDAKLFAKFYAGADLAQKKDDYFRILERYDNSDEYNNDILREARELYPESLANSAEKQREYLQKYGYFGEAEWDWNSDSSRILYWEKRKVARVALQRAGFFLAGALVNRLISMIDCAFFTPVKKFSLVPYKDGLAIIYQF